jgi:peroxin-1
MAQESRIDNQSTASIGQRSVSGKSTTSTSRRRNHHTEASNERATLLRGVGRKLCHEWFQDGEPSSCDSGLKLWVGEDALSSKRLSSTEWICVSLVEPPGLMAPLEPQQQQKARDVRNLIQGKHASRVVAKMKHWDYAPDANHVVLSSALCAALGVDDPVGITVRLDVPPDQLTKDSVNSLKIYPFTQGNARQQGGIRFGGETRASREAAADELETMFGSNNSISGGILNGPLTDGLILPRLPTENSNSSWTGGLIRFNPVSVTADGEKSALRWIHGSQCGKLKIVVQQEIPNILDLRGARSIDEDSLPQSIPLLAGIDSLLSKAITHVTHQSSLLLTGGLGSGKSSVVRYMGQLLRRVYLYHVSYVSCRKFMVDEVRVSMVKETLQRIFMKASWATRMGGYAMVILDDLDVLCPAETELQVGNENGRSRQLSEVVRSIACQYCGGGSRVVLVVTGISKDALNGTVVGGHVIRESLELKAPVKDVRRQVLSLLTNRDKLAPHVSNGVSARNLTDENNGWMDGSPSSSPRSPVRQPDALMLGHDLDLLEIAGQTDGFMPGDLVLLLSRAKGEALIRTAKQPVDLVGGIKLCNADFQAALQDFKPASLRNVTLQSSTITFDSIGGLRATRKTLVETLQYPTSYAPIFAQCPLRLRSGLLLYGFPGCGKTLLASAVAGEFGLNFISVKGPEILNKYIGASEKSVRDLFEKAEAAKPCVLFFDEFDSIAPKRGHDSTGVTDRVVNQLLTQMDGAEGLTGVYVLAATSRPDLIDPALLRPGRLDKALLCGMPDYEDRLDILQALSKNLNISSSVLESEGAHRNLAEVARRTEGYAGADLQAVIYTAQLEAIHCVLGDHKGQTNTGNGTRTSITESSEDKVSSRDVFQFRFGQKEHQLETTPVINPSKKLITHSALLTKLNDAKQARKKESAQCHHNFLDSRGQERKTRTTSPEIVIDWSHIEVALAETKSSISAQERHKLEKVYTEFQVGRNGEMPSGQGGMEIGARSSLM